MGMGKRGESERNTGGIEKQMGRVLGREEGFKARLGENCLEN
jgi:hypothetical protein